MKKRIFAIILSLAMALTMMPEMFITTWAEDGVTLLVNSATLNDDAERGNNATYKTIGGALAKAAKGDTIQLMSNVTEIIKVDESQEITLDLNGKVLKAESEGSVIINEGTLNVKDSSTTDNYHYFKVDSTGLWVIDDTLDTANYTFDVVNGLQKDGEPSTDIPAENAVIKVTGGCITGGTGTKHKKDPSESEGGGINNEGTLNLYKGNIVGNTATYQGAGISNDNIFTMYDGGVLGNRSDYAGGGIYIAGGQLKIIDGKVIDNIATRGGGVRMWSGTATITGGLISGNRASIGAGFVVNSGTFTLGGTINITGNKKGTSNNNLYLDEGQVITISTDVPPVLTGDNKMCVGINTKKNPAVGEKITLTNTCDKDYSSIITSDAGIYKVKYVPATTDPKVDAYLELVNYNISAITSNTNVITLEDDSMTVEQALAIAKNQKPYKTITKLTKIAYAKASDFATSGKYLYIKSSGAGSWKAASSQTVSGMINDLETADCFVIGTVHAHEWTYKDNSKDNTINKNTIKATCENSDGEHTGSTVETLTITAPTLTQYGQTGENIDENAKLNVTKLGKYTKLKISYKKKGKGKYESLGSTAPTTAGTYRATVTIGHDEDVRSAYVEYTISPITITVTPTSNKSKVYGTDDPEFTYTATDALSGETAKFSGALSREEGSDVKDGGYAITLGTLALVDNESFLASNYELKLNTTPVVFTITKANTLTVSGTSYEGKYDGKEHGVAATPSVTEGTTVKYSIDDGDTWSEDVPTVKDVGTTTVKVKAENINYETANCEYTLVVNKRDVTLTSASDRKKIDNEPLTNNNVTVSGDGFVEGEGATYDVTGSQTDVGTSENAFTYQLEEGTKAGNYDIDTVFGSLEIYEILCTYTAALTTGNQTLLLGNEEAGEFTISGSVKNGFTLVDANGKYVYVSGKSVVRSKNSYTWKYNGGLYTEEKSTVTKGILFWKKKVTEITRYYLDIEDGKLVISEDKVSAQVQIIDDEHTYTYLHDKDGKHEAVCTKCGKHEEAEAHDYTYDKDNHKCICGKIDPDYCFVKDVKVTEKKVTKKTGILFWKKTVTKYQYTLEPKTQDVMVSKVEYSGNNEDWDTGKTFYSDAAAQKFFIRVTDTEGHVTNWKYEDGKVKSIDK